MTNSCVSSNTRDVLQQRTTPNQYELHEKHILAINQLELFNKFKEEHSEVNMSFTTFVQQNPWYVRPISVRDTSVVGIMWNLSYIMTLFLILGKHTVQVHLLFPQFVLSYPKTYVNEKIMRYFVVKNVLVGINVLIMDIWLYFTPSIIFM